MQSNLDHPNLNYVCIYAVECSATTTFQMFVLMTANSDKIALKKVENIEFFVATDKQ